MHTLRFSSSDPLDHVCRALDIIRKMCFDLSSLSVGRVANGGFRIAIMLDVHDRLTVGTLVERVSSFIGVHDLICATDNRSARMEVLTT